MRSVDAVPPPPFGEVKLSRVSGWNPPSPIFKIEAAEGFMRISSDESSGLCCAVKRHMYLRDPQWGGGGGGGDHNYVTA